MTLLSVLQHALGLDEYGRGSMYRNHFVTGEGSSDWPFCLDAVARGLMSRRESSLCGGDSLFIVTDAGKQFAGTESPPPPKLSRSQQRYARYLDADSGLSFGDWLKHQARA